MAKTIRRNAGMDERDFRQAKRQAQAKRDARNWRADALARDLLALALDSDSETA